MPPEGAQSAGLGGTFFAYKGRDIDINEAVE
jgi:hypothetical protein